MPSGKWMIQSRHAFWLGRRFGFACPFSLTSKTGRRNRGTCKINLDFSEGGAVIPCWAVSHGETASLNQCRRCSWALWTACRHTSGQPFTQLGLRIRPLASQAGASESRDALMPLQRRIWSAVSARIPNIRWVMTFPHPRTLTKAPPYSSFNRL